MNEFNKNALGHSNNDVDLTTVTNWLNNAATSQSVTGKVELLHKVQEFVIHKTPWLLPELISDILGFASDRNSDVKKCIVGFIEETCKQDEKLIPKVVVNLHLLLCDESVQVQKRVIQASSSVYKNMIIWLSKAQVISDEIEQAWDVLNHIKVEIVNMIDSDNDGVRTHSIKFLESVVLLQTYPELGAPRKEGDFSLEDIPLTLKIARRRKLEEEANHIFSLLVKFHGSPHISSVNLMACMGSLCTIAKLRSEFMSKVICALEHLQSNLPPTLSHSQVNSVRKHLASVRVVQKNLVFVVGLPVRLADADVLKRHEYFGKFGKIHKVVINQSTSYAGSQGPSASAYVTYVKSDDALRAIQNVNNIMLDGRLIKSSLGTTKYCSHFMKNQPCPKADCMYLHDFGDPEASFTKEQMHMGKHQEYEKKLHEALLNRTAVQQQLQQQQQQQQQQTGCEKTPPPSTQANGTVPPSESKTKQNGGAQKDSNWPTLSTSSSSSSSENSNSSSSGFSTKTEKQQKSESKSEKSQKKSHNQKNKNNNNTSSTNNNIENSKKSEKATTTTTTKNNCDQTNCQQQQSQQNQQQQLTTSIALEKSPVISTKDTSVTPLSVTTSTADNTPTSECIESLAKIQLLDDNSSFFSHNSFQKLLPEQDASSYSTDSSSLTPHSNILTDNLLDINSSEDWQAAFGFANINTSKHHQPDTSPVSAAQHSQAESILSNSSAVQSRNATVVSENGLGGFGNAQSDFGPLNRTENGYKLDQAYSGLNHLENYQKTQQNHSYDVLKPRDSILDVLAGRTISHYNGVVPSYKHLDATSDRLNHTSPYLTGLNQSSKQPLENGLNGLDQMSKFFAEFNKTSQKDAVYNGFNHGSNGFVPTIGERQSYLGGGNQMNLNENQHNLLILNQYQQRLVDKHLEEQQALYNLKQNVFHSQQQQQQQYLHNHNTQQQQPSHQQHHTGTQQQQQQYLTNGGDHFLGQNGQSFGTSAYPQSSVFQNQTLQQRNQVQIRDRSSVDDDLGFDPFHETQKALAELIESEQGVSQNSGHSSNGAGTGPVNGLIHGGNVSANSAPGSCLPPPPPGFMQHTTHMNSFGSKILPFLNMSNSQQISSSGGWSTNYSEAQLKGLAPVNDWMTLDPAIVSSSRHFPLASLQPLRDQYGPFPQQQQQTGPTLRGYEYQSSQQQQSQPPQTNGYTNNTYVSQQQQQQQQQLPTYNTNNYTAQHLAGQQPQANGLSWYGTDLHAQISSPPGFRQATTAAGSQSKSQEC